MNLYLWSKLLHLFFVIGWLATVFALPRVLRALAEPELEEPVRARLLQAGRRVYRLGHNLFGGAFVFGLILWLYFGIAGPWLHAKLLLLAILLVDFILCGRWLKGLEAGKPLPRKSMIPVLVHAPTVLLVLVLWLAVLKPF